MFCFQNSYYYLLRRYLESVYPGCEARSVFLRLIQKISELHRLNDDHVRVYLDVNPKDVEPLLIEIFDLKPHWQLMCEILKYLIGNIWCEVSGVLW